jgi:hypothetical protein
MNILNEVEEILKSHSYEKVLEILNYKLETNKKVPYLYYQKAIVYFFRATYKTFDKKDLLLAQKEIDKGLLLNPDSLSKSEKITYHKI